MKLYLKSPPNWQFKRTKALNILKISALLSLMTIFSTFSNTIVYSQTEISINVENTEIINILDIIESTTDLRFFYDNDIYDFNEKKTLFLEKVDIDKAISEIFNGNLGFRLSDNVVILEKTNIVSINNIVVDDIKDVEQDDLQTIIINGNVNDSDGNPLPGAAILEVGTENGVTTDFDGNFTIELENENAELQFSYIGFKTQTIAVGSSDVINVTLLLDATQMDEIVMVGYGTVRKSDLTGSISTVKAKDLPLSTNTSVEQALNSKAAGLTITSASGQPGAGVNILIRGAANVGASNEPLYIIDGFPVGGSVETQDIGQFGDAGFRSPLNDINPNDIASIEILKDASATAIYGSRAANGVILITTKRGKEGTVKVEYTSNYTSQSISKWLDLLNASEYMTARNEVLLDNGDAAAYTAQEIANAPETTNWFDAISRQGYIHQQNISVNGGTETTKYMASINYFDQQGVIQNSDLNRITGRLNLDQKIGKNINFGLTLTSSTVKNRNVPLGSLQNEFAAPLRSSISFTPLVPIRDEAGNFSISPIPSAASTLANPVSLLDIDDETVTERLFANAFIDVKIIEGLHARAKVGIDKRSAIRNFFSPTTNIFGAQDNGKATKLFNMKDDQLFGITLTYNKQFSNNHNITVLGGYEYQEFNREDLNAGNNDFITDGLLYNDLNAGIGDPRVGSFKSFDELASYFGRINYIYNDRYLLTASIRRDGSPRFGANNKWGVFPSASFAWRIINEDFMANQDTFSDLKLRLGYGQSGNNTISGATALYRTQGNYIYGSTNQSPEFGVQQTRYANPDLKWQTNTEINAGIDFSLFNNRISGSVDYFDKKISDLLGTRQLRTFLPISTIGFNVGATESSGVEVTLNSRNFTGDFIWNTGIIFGTYKDRWTERDPGAILQPYEGQRDLLGSVWIYEYDGIQQISDPIPAHQPNIKPGQPRVNDLNGVDADGNLVPGPDGQITPADRVLIGTTAPGYTFGISNNFSYKGIDFSFFFQGMGDRLRLNSTRALFLLQASTLREGKNVLSEFKDRWTTTNTSSQIPSGTVNSTPGAADRLFWEDAGFLRLRNITLGYTLPSSLSGNVFEKVRVFIDAQNLFTITDYTGIDPEYDDIGAYPNQRSLTMGINLTF